MSAKTPDPVDIEVGHRIRVERLSRGMSQTVLADQLGVTFQQVQKYEKGVNRVGAGRLTKIAEALGVPVSTFFTDQHMLNNGSGTANDDESPMKLLAVPGALRLLRSYAAIDDSNVSASVVDLVERISRHWT